MNKFFFIWKHGKTLEYLLNDKREGTLYSQLKLKGLISSLSAYVLKSPATLNQMEIKFVLTNEGLSNNPYFLFSVMNQTK